MLEQQLLDSRVAILACGIDGAGPAALLEVRIRAVLERQLLFAPPAFAGLDLTWNACNTSGGDSTTVFDCANPDSTAILIGCFQVPEETREP